MSQRRLPRYSILQGGFTLIELLIVIVLGSLVVENVFRLLISQQRSYLQQRQIVDLRLNLRTAASLLVAELRGPAAEDLYAIGANSITIRSPVGSALICADIPVAGATTTKYVLWRETGAFQATTDDSVLVYSAGAGSLGDETWRVLRTVGVTAAGTGTPDCAWGNGARGSREIELRGDTAGVVVGAPVQAFRRTQYGLFQNRGRWWLGRRVGSASGWEELSGPFASPEDGGLVFRYLDRTGAATSTLADVTSIEITLRGETDRALWRDGRSGPHRVLSETYRTRVAIRG